MKTTVTLSQEKQLDELFDKYQAVNSEFSYSDWAHGDVPSGRKKARTIRFQKFVEFASALGYNMIDDLPKCMLHR